MASSSALTLDDLAAAADHHASPAAAIIDDHLFYPTLDESPTDGGTTPPVEQRPLLKDRLYIGNLHPSVDEYTLLQVFAKFGKVTKLDWLYHKAGALKGKPRGYAFVEYATADDAQNALASAHGKLLRGRKLVVTFAQQAPLDAGAPPARRRMLAESGRPTTLSMLKTGLGTRGAHEGKTKDKIAILEAKLLQMERENPVPVASASTPPSTSTSVLHEAVPSSTLPAHPSLPAKPPPQIPGAPAPTPPPARATPPLPIAKPPPLSTAGSTFPGHAVPAGSAKLTTAGLALGGGAAPHRPAKPKLVGVKIKPKEKEKEKGGGKT